jgi:hypothetical protein
MAKVAMALIFIDGMHAGYDCVRATKYLSDEGIEHPFFMVIKILILG